MLPEPETRVVKIDVITVEREERKHNMELGANPIKGIVSLKITFYSKITRR
jgi:hypothetical protein